MIEIIYEFFSVLYPQDIRNMKDFPQDPSTRRAPRLGRSLRGRKATPRELLRSTPVATQHASTRHVSTKCLSVSETVFFFFIQGALVFGK